MRESLDYRSAGVDLEAADDAKRRIRQLVESTFTEGALGKFGGFGGMFRIPSGLADPVLVASADGVGTKVKVAVEAGRHDTVGQDLVNHCVNDILVQGAVPLFFLDYLAFGRLEPQVVEELVSGVAAACRENGCVLLGGETAEMPDVYTPPDYDIAGFIVGVVESDAVLGASRVQDGDVMIGLASSGLHTNGYSLARRIVFDKLGLGARDAFPGGGGTVADVLLAVHRSYLRPLRPVLQHIHAMAHITGGGIPGNVARALPDNLDAMVDLPSWHVPEVFAVLQREGGVSGDEMFRSFNMGVGMVVITAPDAVDRVISSARSTGVAAWRFGRIVPGSGGVILKNGGSV